MALPTDPEVDDGWIEDSANTSKNEPANWAKMPYNMDNWGGYSHVVDGWKNTRTDAEVLVGKTGTGDQTDKDWMLQHPWDDEVQNHTQYTDTHDDAVEMAQEWMDDHPAPAFVY